MTHSITLYSAQQAHDVLAKLWAYVKPRVMAGHKLRLSIAEEKRSLPQNDHIQRKVRDICAQVGRKDHDTVRALLVEQWRHETKRPQQFAPSMDGLRMVDVSNRSSALDKPDASEFLEWLIAWDAMTNV